MGSRRLNKSKKCFKRIRRHCYISERSMHSEGRKPLLGKRQLNPIKNTFYTEAQSRKVSLRVLSET